MNGPWEFVSVTARRCRSTYEPQHVQYEAVTPWGDVETWCQGRFPFVPTPGRLAQVRAARHRLVAREPNDA